jgi:hypothetical protein
MMAGLEIVVRPFIFPSIRPRPRAALPPQDDPTKGFATISGNPAGSTSSSQSVSISSSHSRPKEVSRRVDETRVYQEEDDGTINKDNYVDIEVANKITMQEPAGVSEKGSDQSKTVEKQHFYEPVEEDDNVEVKRRNVNKKAKGQA